MFAARDLGRFELALTLNDEAQDSQRHRDAPEVQQARTAFNNYNPLMQLGRLDQARDLLIACRHVFEATNDIELLGKTLGALADVEDELGHTRQAVDLVCDALRYIYVTRQPDPIATSHNNLAIYLERLNADPRQVAAHLTAAALINFQTGSGRLPGTLEGLGRLLQASPDAAPGSVSELCAIVDQVDGVHLQALLDRLPQPADPQEVLDTVLQTAAQAAAERNASLVGLWDPVLAALHATLNGSEEDEEAAGQVLDTTLNQRQQKGWSALVQVLRRIQAGERDRDSLTAGLDQVDTTITGRALDLLAGVDVGIDPDSWQELTGDPDQADALDRFVSLLVAVAGGDPKAREQVAPVLEGWEADPETQALADVLGRLIAGDRTVSVEGLTEEHAGLVKAVLAGLEQEPQPGQSGT